MRAGEHDGVPRVHGVKVSSARPHDEIKYKNPHSSYGLYRKGGGYAFDFAAFLASFVLDRRLVAFDCAVYLHTRLSVMLETEIGRVMVPAIGQTYSSQVRLEIRLPKCDAFGVWCCRAMLGLDMR
eukprot:733955-Rhodomonas_salina.1